jgi:hypothetical protein
MKETIDIKTEDFKESGSFKGPNKKSERNKPKRNVNRWGVYLSLIFIAAGLIWYAINLGIIPMEFIRQQAGPIVIVILGILILIKSL